MKDIRIALADDHPVVVQGLISLIEDCNDLTLVASAVNGQELLEKLQVTSADVVLLDIDMPVLDGVETTRRLKAEFPAVKVLILTMHDEKHFIRKLIEEGAHGYLLKNCSREELTLAVRNVYDGKNQFSGEVTMKLAEADESEPDGLTQLTQREIEILALIAQGKSNKEIGEELFISHRTVDTHRTNLMKKLEVHNIAGLIRIAYDNGLIQ